MKGERKLPTHLPALVWPSQPITIELPSANVTSRQPFGFSRALPADPAPMIEAMAAQLEVEE